MRASKFAVVVLAVAAVAALAACASKAPDDTDGGGEPCSATVPCKSGFVCDLTEPAGSDCIPADGDLDGDGLDNAHDFCDHMPGGAYDEDHDGIGDECDRCPIAPPPAVADTDHDDVDSPCDPYPDTDGDSIFLFDGFNGTYGSNWGPSPATAWQIEGGELVATQGATGNAVMSFPLTLPSNRFAILTAYRIDAAPTDSFNEVSMTGADTKPAGVATFDCGALRSGPTDSLVVQTDQDSQMMALGDLFDTGGLYQVTARQDGGEAGCVVIADSADTAAIQATVTADPMSLTAFSVHDVTARFEYVLIVGH